MKPPFIHAVLACLVCGAALVGYRVWYGIIEEKSAVVAALENQITSHLEAESSITVAQTSLAQIAEYENSIQNYFVPETNIALFNDNLEMQGKAQGATVTVLSVAKSGTTLRPMLALALSIQGTFDAVMRTIGVIEYAPYAVTITGLSLQHAEEKLWHANLNLNVGSVSTAIATSTP